MLVLMVTVTVMMVVAWAVPVVVTLKAGAWVRTTASDGDDDDVKQGVGDGGGGLFQHRRSLATSVSDSNVGVSKAATAASQYLSNYQNGRPRVATSSSRAWLITTAPSGPSSPGQPVSVCPSGKSPSWAWRFADQWRSCSS